MHAVTCTRLSGIQQVAHGGLIGRTSKPNYLVVTVQKNKLSLELKEIDLVNGKGMLWQKNKSRGPYKTIAISEARKKRGFTSIGTVQIIKKDGGKSFSAIRGIFDEKKNPVK